MKEIYVISDTHFGHKRIIELCNRPFTDVNEMDEIMIDRWNETVRNEDTVIFGGDFMFYKKDEKNIFNRLKGNKILICGNHDHTVTKLMPWLSSWERFELEVDNVNFIIDHYPIHDWNKRFHNSIHLYGHTHKSLYPEIVNRHCICVEVQDYRPKNIREFIKKG